MAGDRIVMVDDSLFVGKKVTNERAMRTLKGPKGTQVKLGVKRATEKDLLNFTITRGDIPQNTIDAAYMLTDDFGYIQVSKFGRTTHVELLNAIALLNHKELQRADHRFTWQHRRIYGSRSAHGQRILARR